jgi:hypothetical protein
MGALPHSAGVHPLHRLLSFEVHQQPKEFKSYACPMGILHPTVNFFLQTQIWEDESGSQHLEPPSYVVVDLGSRSNWV